MATDILKVISIMALIFGINLGFQDAAARRRFKNTNQPLNYDSMIIHRYDSLLEHTTNYRDGKKEGKEQQESSRAESQDKDSLE